MIRIVVALALLSFLVGCTPRTTLVLPPGVPVESVLPSPGFHLYVNQDGTFLIDGINGDIRSLEKAIEASFNMVDSASISILLTLEDGARIPSEVRQLIIAPGIDVYSLKRIKVE